MNWVDLLDRAEFLRILFAEAPSLHLVRVFEIDLHQDGPRVHVTFELNEFPEKPPPKWLKWGANQVQVRLMGVGVRDLELRGWTANNIATIEIVSGTPDGVLFTATGVGFQFRGVFDQIFVDNVTAYQVAS